MFDSGYLLFACNLPQLVGHKECELLSMDR